MWTHEESYKGRGITPYIHRKRLKLIFGLFESLDAPAGGSLADFGCSNGYILSLFRGTVFPNEDRKLVGFDHSEELLALARAREIPNAEFYRADLNSLELDPRWREHFDIVTCFETIEHTGNSANAFQNLYAACKVGGVVLVSMPNEKGLPGLAKFLGRKILRKDPYGDFFDDSSEWAYFWRLMANQPLDVFRSPGREAWGPHLGFDWENFATHVAATYIETGKLELRSKRRSFLKLNLFFAYRKIA
ncbi:MAG: class I SAM-dependent methyltransferase [Candidatus Latescibacterota bacterium]|nr:MAG: class I SAM-dependent methyltransferase [Candidatus Latescibacterota bacterium]